MAEDSSSSPTAQEYPNVHAAYEIFLEYNKFHPENATQLVKWCSKQGIKDIQYAQVNKYLRIRREKEKDEETDKRRKPVVKSSNQPLRPPVVSSSVKQHSQRILNQLEDHSKTRTSAELGFDKGQIKHTNFQSFIQNFDKVAEEEKKAKESQWDIIKQRKQETPKEKGTHVPRKDSKFEEKAKEELKEIIDIKLEEELSSFNASNEIGSSENVKDSQDESNDWDPIATDDDTSTTLESGSDERQNAVQTTNPSKSSSKPWLRYKPNWSEQSKMAIDSPQTEELKNWLESNKFGSFFEKMYENGVETLDDLRALQTESDVMELAGSSGINMGIVFRKKFVRCVLELSTASSQPTTDGMDITEALSQDNFAGKINELTKVEQDALNQLVSAIKEHTVLLKMSCDDLANIKQQSEELRQKISELFDKAMGVLLVRRKNLENAINLKEVERVEMLQKRIDDFQSSAKNLLKCKQSIEQQFKTVAGGSERQHLVTNLVEVSLKSCPSKEYERGEIVFDQGNVPLIEFLENYGRIAVAIPKV